MDLPDFIKSFPALDIPFPDEVVKSYAIRSDHGLVVFFDFIRDMELPPHSHLAQWGTVLSGEIEFTIEGETRVLGPGSIYSIPAGAQHGAVIKAGTRVIDVFEEPDRYPIKPTA
ncbi:Cupin domain-containing protein [Roseibium hamelinense]|uniref:Cupin domain-containing protein n=1 Tax=Roseibium hamelinense TaxID=150831 RepID=A0A562T9P7_9HYPH|nr:cupin domain-containing protein [Roseibium hamelinense]MTI45229.1 cupin domain-containing protein [Roseibium hamelinense]TWI90407.1 Cupin domain-containing protein [Roseibium hamelinense]